MASSMCWFVTRFAASTWFGFGVGLTLTLTLTLTLALPLTEP